MSVVDEIVKDLGGPKAVADELQAPVKTVYDWRAKKKIPSWRRRALREIAARKCVILSLAAQQYLAGPTLGAAPEPASAE